MKFNFKYIIISISIFIIISSIIFGYTILKGQSSEIIEEQAIVEKVEEKTESLIIEEEVTKETTPQKKKTTKTTQKNTNSTTSEKAATQTTFTGFITHYGPDCKGCGGTTAAGYNVKNTIYYNDKTYGTVRIVAMSKNYPLYSIIRISNYKQGSIIAIVLDRGGAIKGNKIDLLVNSEAEASKLGIQKNAQIEVLRLGK